ncbi:uncharacterized protein LOC117180471 [Belonocnema kinseyi]|uniref:uncharacterized protein LOC117180471 n=1 Tax=Belonocnema kinseyi TaxID=2817044 RepID=UPI00143CF16F|nr:uncharacterized protein LOC117180471 [Belonocnema kinseyi]
MSNNVSRLFYHFSITLQTDIVVGHQLQSSLVNSVNQLRSYYYERADELKAVIDIANLQKKDTSDCQKTYADKVTSSIIDSTKQLQKCLKQDAVQSALCSGNQINSCKADIKRIMNEAKKCIQNK